VLVANDNDLRYVVEGLRNSSIKGLTAIATGSTSDEWPEGTIPAWAILWAFRQLEFHGVLRQLPEDEKALHTLAQAFPGSELETDRESWHWVVDLPGMAERDAETRVLIIAPSISSPPDWTVEPNIAALQLHMDSNRAAESSVLRWLSERQRFTLALVDIGELDNADVKRILRQFLDSPNNVVALSSGREAGGEISGVPVIRYMDSLGQAVWAAREALEGYGYKPEQPVRRKT
jgi:hypothetical protein